MKRIFSLICCISVSILPFAQIRQQDKVNPDIKRAVGSGTRCEIILPEVDGFKAIKTDLHVHTFYSDGDCSPEYRIHEAWRDGLDAVAITDHIEYHPANAKMASFLGVQCPENCDLNMSVNLARPVAESLGLTLIPGTEITRSPAEPGHFNVLFTTDNNKIPDSDPIVAMKNAKAQGAIVQNNHPGWARKDALFTETTKKALAAGLIDGVECINDTELYQRTIEDASANGIYVCAGTDIHGTTFDTYLRYGAFRNMTIVFAKDNSAPAIREALLARRTLAYGFGDICGEEQLLEKFFLASFEFRTVSADKSGKKRILVVNKSSLPYMIDVDEASVDVRIPAFSSKILTSSEDGKLVLRIKNMWCGVEKHPQITVTP